MIRKILVVAAAVAMPLGIVAVSGGGVAGAKAAPKVDATKYTLTCTGIAATAKFSPALTTNGGAASNEVTTIKGTASHCTATPNSGGTAVTITKASISGTITSADSTHTCGALASPTTESGNITTKWTTTPKLTATSSVLAVSQVQGGIGANGDATFGISYTGATGPFQGTDGGASDATSAQTSSTISTILASCNGKSGLKSIAIEPNTNSGAPTAIVLG
jgi:hypothetical protein